MVSRVRKGGNSHRRHRGNPLRGFHVPEAVTNSFIEDFYITLDSPLSLSCWMLFHYGEHDQLAKKEIDPRQYIDGGLFRRDYCAVSLVSKYPYLDTSFDRTAIALASFSEAEHRCGLTTSRLRSERCRAENLQHELVLSVQARKISSILREFDVSAVFEKGSFGPGVTSLLRGRDTSSSRKYAEGRDITPGAYLLFAESLIAYAPSWSALGNASFVSGNSVDTVPKNAKTDRTIAIEPTLNSWLQLGIGRLIRERLRSCGYDLDSDYWNREYAKLGARYGSLATLDFKNASNTISVGVVERLLPTRWFLALDAARSHNYTLGGSTHRSYMFSTMGNGFTFELESLLFVTAAEAVCEVYGLSTKGISIFGDDLTCHSSVTGHLTEYISYLGFELNRSKSYADSMFRESCGDHYFGRLDCKPLLLRNRVGTIAQIFDLSNRLLLLAHRFNGEFGLDRRFRELWQRLVDVIPHKFRLWGPASYGAAVLFSPTPVSQLKGVRRHRCWDGWTFTHLSARSRTLIHDSDGHMLARLRNNQTFHSPYEWDVVAGRIKSCVFLMRMDGTSKKAPGNKVPLRGVVSLILSRRGFSNQWYDFRGWY